MEKLKKLSDFKSNELNNNEMFMFKGAIDECTGGGFEQVWLSDGNGGYCTEVVYEWDSDVNYEVSKGVWATRYHGERAYSGSCW